MTQGINDLIAAISSGNAEAIDTAFQSEMANRISTRLEDLRVSVAQNMFATEQAVIEEPTEEDAEAPVEESAEEDAEPFEAE